MEVLFFNEHEDEVITITMFHLRPRAVVLLSEIFTFLIPLMHYELSSNHYFIMAL